MLLSEITHPNQLHGLSIRQLEDIARQIREKHLETVATSGGHLGPGLGVVELTLALYQTLDLDRDKVTWDVGHQAYPHKLITGRYHDFHTLRQKDGVAGYLKRSESPFDHFGQGTLLPVFLLRWAWPWPATWLAMTTKCVPLSAMVP
jgi:1-deoxy-D-xylulose-5-phosphate synthase